MTKMKGQNRIISKSYQGKEIQNTAVFKMIYFLYQSDHTFIAAEERATWDYYSKLHRFCITITKKQQAIQGVQLYFGKDHK